MKGLIALGSAVIAITVVFLIWASSADSGHENSPSQLEIDVDRTVGQSTSAQSDGIDSSEASRSDYSGSDIAGIISGDTLDDDRSTTSSSATSDNDHGSRVIAQDRMRELRDRIRRANHLPAENLLVRNENIDIQSSTELLKSDETEYEEFLDALDEQSLDDSLAHELTDLYRDYLRNSLDTEGFDFSVDRLHCGLRICAGRAVADSDQWQEYFDRIGAGENDLPVYSVVRYLYELENGLTENRFVFSIDPDSASIIVPRTMDRFSPTPPRGG